MTRDTYSAMMRELKISLEEQRTLMRHEDLKTTIGYGGKSPAEVGQLADRQMPKLWKC
ncbi:MAG TPA: hypothetical protein VIX90_15565 [Edaphobacter sp.]